MAINSPFWEVCSTMMTRKESGKVVSGPRKEWYGHLKGRNGRIVMTTETYLKKKSVLAAINIVDPDSRFDIREIDAIKNKTRG